MQPQQPQQTFQLNDLTGAEVEAIMVGLNELPAKTSRAVMNKLESQIVYQVRAQSVETALAKKPAMSEPLDESDMKAGLSD